MQLMYVIGKWSKGIRHSRSLIVLAIVSSLLAGVGYTLLIALIKQALSGGLQTQSNLIWTFVAFCLV